jgi:CRP/FNR family transcriptional regulator, cyclic AMP receptor protein
MCQAKRAWAGPGISSALVADIVEIFGRVPLFAGLRESDLKKLTRQLTARRFRAGQTITTQGQSGIGFFVIEEGTATVEVEGEVVRTLGEGDYFGEVALIDSGPRSATITATTDLRCRGMTAWEFRPFVHEHPEVAWALMEYLVARLREAEARAEA